jgi:hypothetical protein
MILTKAQRKRNRQFYSRDLKTSRIIIATLRLMQISRRIVSRRIVASDSTCTCLIPSQKITPLDNPILCVVHNKHQCEECNRRKKVNMERLLIIKVLVLLSCLLALDVSTVLVFCGFNPDTRGTYKIGIIVWGAVVIPIVIAAGFLWAKMVKHSNRINDMLIILVKAAAAYIILSFIISIISTLVVLIWNGPRYRRRKIPEYHCTFSMVDCGVISQNHQIQVAKEKEREGRDREMRIETYFFSSLVLVSYFLFIAGCNKFSVTRQLLIETAVFLVVTFVMVLIVATTRSGVKGRIFLVICSVFELIATLVYQLIRLFNLCPNSHTWKTKKQKSSRKIAHKNVKEISLKRLSKVIFSQKGGGHETENSKEEP